MHPERYCVRRARASDAGQLVALMRRLAVFESYLDTFCVGAEDLQERGLADNNRDEPRQFTAMVAEHRESSTLAGYAVYLVTPFTHDLRPLVTLKELFVEPKHRRQGIAEALFDAVREDAVELGAGQIRWLVLPDNEVAKNLYRRCGGQPDLKWALWELQL